MYSYLSRRRQDVAPGRSSSASMRERVSPLSLTPTNVVVWRALQNTTLNTKRSVAKYILSEPSIPRKTPQFKSSSVQNFRCDNFNPLEWCFIKLLPTKQLGKVACSVWLWKLEFQWGWEAGVRVAYILHPVYYGGAYTLLNIAEGSPIFRAITHVTNGGSLLKCRFHG